MPTLSRFKCLASPILERPVLIIESDDWGPGPGEQANALNAICHSLHKFKDEDGRHPIMTIGVILSIPDGEAILERGEYQAKYLNEPEYQNFVDVLLRGVEKKVLDLQLHGMAHYWPDNLIGAYPENEEIKDWLKTKSWQTEKLPSWLQSRWINGRSLPSSPLEYEKIKQAVEEEIGIFRQCFGFSPKVVVPPTFVWDENVEKAYGEFGVEVLITPGKQYSGRDGKGNLIPPEREFRNGQKLSSGLHTLIRDIYFEPSFGHSPAKVLENIAHKWSRREPALLETHRFNFLGKHLSASLNCMESLLRDALVQFPQIKFISSYQLATEMTRPIGASLVSRLQTTWRRLH